MELSNKVQIAKELTLGVINRLTIIPENYEAIGNEIGKLFTNILKEVSTAIDYYEALQLPGLSDDEIEVKLIDTHSPCSTFKALGNRGE